MKQEIIINSTTSETRIAQIEDGQLVEMYVERPDMERMVGNLYKGVVRKVMVGMSAAFIDIGWSQDAFLHFSDLGGGNEIIGAIKESRLEETEKKSKDGRRYWDGHSLKVGQQILVQVIKEPIGHKGPRVSTQVSIPGRVLVLVPVDAFVAVSRKITDYKEKKRLKIMAVKVRPKGFGLIVRTMADTRLIKDFNAEIKRVMQTWRKIESTIRSLQGPGLVHKDMSLASSTIRDLFTPDVSAVVVDARKLYKELINYIEDVAPTLRDRVKLYTDRTPIYDKYGIESEIEKSLSRKIWMNGGGYLFFDQTEALVAIDVNSGGFVGKRDHEANSLQVNLRAAKEISRQMRLRDMGGLVVIDFIDLMVEANRFKVFDEMRRAMRMDRAKWDMAPLSPFGLMEMTRQRRRPSLVNTLRVPCTNCHGTGLVPSLETIVAGLERWIKRFRSKTSERRLELRVNEALMTYLSGGIKSRMARIMWANRMFITLTVDDELRVEEFRGISQKQQKDMTEEFMDGNDPRKKVKTRKA